MKDLLLTTALISLIAAAPTHAQTTDNTTDGTTATDAGNATDTGNATTDTTTTDTTTDTATDTATDMDTTAMITPPEGYTQYETAALTVDDLKGATIYDANGESVGAISDVVMASTTTGTATTESADATTGTDATGDVVDPNADPGPTASTTDGTAEGDTGAEVNVDGQLSHVVLDVGGFLGIGAHTVAVPMGALQVFRDANEDVRVYLPWTQAQLEALPEYDADDPATLGTADGTAGTSGDLTTGTGSTTSTDNSMSTGDATSTDNSTSTDN